jgi:Queuosine biosynthesis protein QueC
VRSYTVVVNDCAAPPALGVLAIRTRDTLFGVRNFSLRFDDAVAGLPDRLTDLQMDWLEILGCLFAVDMACERGQGDVEWARQISAHIPVRDPGHWEAFRPQFELIWSDLTQDDLTIHFEADPTPTSAPRQSRTPFVEHDGVALLSGGQDSFAGALELLLDRGERPFLLSHSASGAVNTAQTQVESILRGIRAETVRVRIGAGKAPNQPFPGSESSQRSRTLLFVGVAALVAVAGGSNRVYLNENGIMAVHVPLTAARIGSLSTHTASPPIVAKMQQLAAAALGGNLAIDNILIGRTKPEVVEVAVALGHGDDMQHTVSCWQIGRTRTHCGFCAPCIMRRISCETHGVPDVPYDADVFEDPHAIDDQRARDNLTHFVALIDDLASLPDVDLEYEYPELLTGSPAMNLADCIALHRRWATQAQAVLGSHTVPTSLR